MTLTMHLHPKPFADVAGGHKTFELRVNDPKRRAVEVGQRVVIIPRAGGETLEVEVVDKVLAPSFAVLLSVLPPALVHTNEDELRQYYTPEEEHEWGVVGLELKRV